MLFRSVGTKFNLADELEFLTRIPTSILRFEEPLSRSSIAQKFSWASARKTTRPEDTAYCLFGLLDINMPTLYGEGGKNAFRRLQEELIKRSTDTTLLAWGVISRSEILHTVLRDGIYDFAPTALLADDPSQFYRVDDEIITMAAQSHPSSQGDPQTVS